jgi:ribosome modulation factor
VKQLTGSPGRGRCGTQFTCDKRAVAMGKGKSDHMRRWISAWEYGQEDQADMPLHYTGKAHRSKDMDTYGTSMCRNQFLVENGVREVILKASKMHI